MKLHPTAGWVLIEELPEEEKTSAGVYMPETSKDKSVKGKVIRNGDSIMAADAFHITNAAVEKDHGFMMQLPPCKEEQIVIFKKWATNEVNDNGKKYVLVKFEDILGIYEK